MAKNLKYPKKFRAKLEQVAAGREGRQAAQDRNNVFKAAAKQDFIHTLWHEFWSPASMDICVMDCMQMPAKVDWWMNQPAAPEYVLANAPWLSDEPAS